ncbi:MAG TPA: winged helix-turn-helix domain-containing protein [Steroidobacteraceae bacterium]|nr:winged helix-turn-helix domain-containing protein [Steroidobacteraceae bacterium]
MDTPAQPGLVLRFGPFELNAAAEELRENGRLRRIPPQPFRVLFLLADRAGQIVTRKEIRHCLWGERKYVDVEHGINFCVSQIRGALHDPAELSRYIKTVPRRGYCFVAPTDRLVRSATGDAAIAAAAEGESSSNSHIHVNTQPRREIHRVLRLPAAAVILLALLSIPMSTQNAQTHAPAPLTEKDFVVVADFANTTGEEAFDDSLRQALAIELRQSPFLNVLADAKVRQTLKRMGRPDNQRMTPDVAQNICLRTGSKAVLDGKISKLGSHYLMSLTAVACDSSDALASTQGEAARRDDVLATLSKLATQLRAGLGESLRSVQKFDVPVEVTTTSLEALKSYSDGLKVLVSKGDAPSIPFFSRAIELDPDFSMAYATLAARYNNLDQPAQALRLATRAYELRDRVSERERLVITTRYLRLTGQLEKLTQALDMWISEYPRDAGPHGSLGSNYAFMGEYSKALTEWQTAVRLAPDDVSMYENLGVIYLALNRPLEAEQTLNSAFSQNLDSGGLRWAAYYLGFVQKDSRLMQQQAQWSVGKPGSEDILLSAQADTEGFFGRLRSAREFSRRAVDSAIRSDYPEAAALWQVNAALREAEFNEPREARSGVRAALALSAGRNVKMLAALTLARLGDADQAETIANELQSENPRNTVFAHFRLPSIAAAIALSRGNPARAVECLEAIRPYELGEPSPSGLAPLYPAYLRGLAYLSMHDGAAAAVEFKKVLDNPGIALNFAPAALAQLDLARAYVLAKDAIHAAAAYDSFLSLWKDADTNIPIRAVAEQEVARLRQAQKTYVQRARIHDRAPLATNALPRN